MALGDGTGWDESVPTNSTFATEIDDYNRDLRLGIRIRMEYEHATFASSSVGGKHKFITFQEQASKPTLASPQVAALYTKDDGASDQDLYFEREDGTEVQLTDGAALNESNPTNSQVMSTFRNLVVEQITAATVDIDADEVVVQDTSDVGVRVTGVNLTVDLSASGANGLDTGSEAANTIYYVWVIRKSSDGTVAGLLSLASAIGSITFPTGYDQAALVGVVGNDGSSNILDFIQHGIRYEFKQWLSIASGNVGTGSWTSIDLTPTTLSFFVPSVLSTRAFGSAGNGHLMLTNDNTVSATTGTRDRNKFALDTGQDQKYWEFEILTTDTLYWASNAADREVWLAGFILNKLT